MRDVLIIGGTCVVAILLGAWLFFGGNAGAPLQHEGPVTFSVVREGQDSGGITERKNYRIKSQEELSELWRMIYGEGGPAMPIVNFEQNELLAVFDGTHSSGGYSVSVVSVEDSGLSRTVTITHTRPGDSCITTQAITSPFQIIVLPKSVATIARVEQEEVTECN